MPAVCSGSRVHPLPCWQPHLLREGWWPYPYMQSQRTAITICKLLYPLHSGSRSSWPQNIRNQALVALTSCFSVLEEVSLTLSLFLLWHSSSVLKFMLANVRFSTAPSLRSSWREGDRKGMQGYLNRLLLLLLFKWSWREMVWVIHWPVCRTGLCASLLLIMPPVSCSCVFLPCVWWQQWYHRALSL